MKNGAFRALLLKEWREVFRNTLVTMALIASFYGRSMISRGAPAVNDPGPALRFDWFAMLGAVAAFLIGFYQTSREARGSHRGFALHRPASHAQIFGAKVIAGGGSLMLLTGIPYAMASSLARGNGIVGLADLASMATAYAAGLLAGSRGERRMGQALAVLAAMWGVSIVSTVHPSSAAIAVSAILATVLVAAAWADFARESELEAEPVWGRAATVLSGMAGLALPFYIGAVTTGILPFAPAAGEQARSFVPGGATVPVTEYARVLPAYEAWHAAVIDGNALRLAGAIAVGLLCAGITWAEMKRYAFPPERRMAWTLLAAAAGPMGPILMWSYLEWPRPQLSRSG